MSLTEANLQRQNEQHVNAFMPPSSSRIIGKGGYRASSSSSDEGALANRHVHKVPPPPTRNNQASSQQRGASPNPASPSSLDHQHPHPSTHAGMMSAPSAYHLNIGAGGETESCVSGTPSLSRGMNKEDMRAQLRALRLQGGRKAISSQSTPVGAATTVNTFPKQPERALYVPFAVAVENKSKTAVDTPTASGAVSAMGTSSRASPIESPTSTAPNDNASPPTSATPTRTRGLSLNRRPLSSSAVSGAPPRDGSETGRGESPSRPSTASQRLLPLGRGNPRGESLISSQIPSIAVDRTFAAAAPKSPRQLARDTTVRVLQERLQRAEQDLLERKTRASDAAAISMLLVAMENTAREIREMEMPTPSENSRLLFDRCGNEVKSTQPSDRDQFIRLLIEKKAARINHKQRIPPQSACSPNTNKSNKQNPAKGGSPRSSIATTAMRGGTSAATSPSSPKAWSAAYLPNDGMITITPSQQDDVLAMYDQLHRTRDLLHLATGLLQNHCLRSLHGLSPSDLKELGVDFSSSSISSPDKTDVRSFLDRVSLTNVEVAESLSELNSKFRSRLQQLQLERKQQHLTDPNDSSSTPRQPLTPMRKYIGSSDLIFDVPSKTDMDTRQPNQYLHHHPPLPDVDALTTISASTSQTFNRRGVTAGVLRQESVDVAQTMLGQEEDDDDNVPNPLQIVSPFSADVAKEMIRRRCGLEVPVEYYRYPLTGGDVYQQQVQDYLGALAFVADVHRGRLRVESADTLSREKHIEMEKRSRNRDRQHLQDLQQETWAEVESIGSGSDTSSNSAGEMPAAAAFAGRFGVSNSSGYYQRLAHEIEANHPLNKDYQRQQKQQKEAARAARAKAESFEHLQSIPGEAILREISGSPNRRAKSPIKYRSTGF